MNVNHDAADLLVQFARMELRITLTDADYVLRCVNAIGQANVPAGMLTLTCPECGQHADGDHDDFDVWHVTDTDGHVILGCEGYWCIDPAIVGIRKPFWTAAERTS